LLWLIWRWGLAFCPGQPGPSSSNFMLPAVAVMTGVLHTPTFFLLRWGLTDFLPRLALTHDPPDLSLLSS
jgi:hypothetical protein